MGRAAAVAGEHGAHIPASYSSPDCEVRQPAFWAPWLPSRVEWVYSIAHMRGFRKMGTALGSRYIL